MPSSLIRLQMTGDNVPVTDTVMVIDDAQDDGVLGDANYTPPTLTFDQAGVTATVAADGSVTVGANIGTASTTSDFSDSSPVLDDTSRNVVVSVVVPSGYSNTGATLTSSVQVIQLGVDAPEPTLVTTFFDGNTRAELAASPNDPDQSTGHTYSWTRDGVALAATSATIAITQSGVYVVTVTDDDNYQGSAMASITLNIGPSASLMSDKLTALPSENVALTMTSSDSDGTITNYRLQKDGVDLYNSSTELTAFSATGHGLYNFIVTDNNGATAQSGLEISNSSQDGTAQYGDYMQTGSGGGTTSFEYGSYGSYEPGLGTRTSDFTQERSRPVTEVTSAAYVDEERTCELLTSQTGDGMAGRCSNPDNPIGGVDSRRRETSAASSTVVTPTVANGGIQRRPITVTDSGPIAFNESTSGIGDQNSDQDTLDSGTYREYTTSPNIGMHRVYTITNNETPQVTVRYTVPANITISSASLTSGSTFEEGVGTTRTYTIQGAPNPGWGWSDGINPVNPRTWSVTHTFTDDANVDLTIDIDDTVTVTDRFAWTSGAATNQGGNDQPLYFFFSSAIPTLSSNQTWAVPGTPTWDSGTGTGNVRITLNNPPAGGTATITGEVGAESDTITVGIATLTVRITSDIGNSGLAGRTAILSAAVGGTASGTTTYNWTATGGTISSGQSTASATIDWDSGFGAVSATCTVVRDGITQQAFYTGNRQ